VLTASRRGLLRPLVVAASAAVLSLSLTPGVAQASSGDVDCLSVQEVPISGVALSRQETPGNTTVHAFGTGLDDRVWTRQIGGSWAGWTSLGGVSLYGPAAVFSGSTNNVFVIGGDGAVWTRSNAGSGWGPWSSLGGYFTMSPAAASLGNGHLRVFGTGADNALWTNEFAGGRWSGWYSLGGQMVAPPVATNYPAYGQIEVSVMGTDGLVWTLGLGQGARSGQWFNRDFAACSTLSTPSQSTVAFPGDRVYVDYDYAMRKQDRTGGGYTNLGGQFTANPDVEYNGVGYLTTTVAGIGGDNAMWVQDNRLGSGWVSLGGQFY
jgi:hypothetical protein